MDSRIQRLLFCAALTDCFFFNEERLCLLRGTSCISVLFMFIVVFQGLLDVIKSLLFYKHARNAIYLHDQKKFLVESLQNYRQSNCN